MLDDAICEGKNNQGASIRGLRIDFMNKIWLVIGESLYVFNQDLVLVKEFTNEDRNRYNSLTEPLGGKEMISFNQERSILYW